MALIVENSITLNTFTIQCPAYYQIRALVNTPIKSNAELNVVFVIYKIFQFCFMTFKT